MPSKKKKASNSASSCEFQFDKEEKVLVLPKQSTDNIYEAKILDRKMDKKSSKAQYKIHYKGWNKRWDEWVSCRRLLQINASNIQLMKDKQAQSAVANQQENDSQHAEQGSTSTNNEKKKKRKLRASPNDTHNNNKSKRRKLNHNEEQKQQSSMSNHAEPLDIKLPTTLKRKLIHDWELITKKSQLIGLPRSEGYRITDILADFESYAIKAGQNKSVVVEISRGIKDYFNQALQVTLLYKLERKQYHEVIASHPQSTMCQIYGVEHLCRLFVKLPQLLSPSDLDADTRKILKQQIEFMIDFILQAAQKYFENTIYNALS